jgi:hypothetical protein
VLPRTRRIVVVTSAVGALMGAALVSLATQIPYSGDRLRQLVIDALSERLDSDVQLESLTLRIYPRIHVEGTGLAVRHRGRRDVPPLISADAFHVRTDLVGLWRKRVALVELKGLHIQIPPDGDRDDARPDAVATLGEGREPDATADGDRLGPEDVGASDVVVDELVADQARLTILRSNPAKKPKVWQMHELRVRSVGVGQKMPFASVLTNAVPPGRIDTTGSFGPWNVDDPGGTPLEGRFTFENADLSVFKGIRGKLSAHGTYGGALDTIAVDGKTETPDFQVTLAGHRVPLETTYRAIVDGTNGNTTLERVEASFLGTRLVASGGVYDVEDVKGRLLALNVMMDKGRLEDVMKLAVKSKEPPMTGALKLETKLEIPPGDADVVDKLRLDGAFVINGGRFSDPGVQRKIAELSRRASNRATGPAPARVDSDFSGRFVLGDGLLRLQTVTFDVPGAAVELSGRYALRHETLAFTGNLFMDAKLSQATTGWKSLLLKVVDPLFRRDGRTVVPLKIGGTRRDPQFGLDVKRALTRGDD